MDPTDLPEKISRRIFSLLPANDLLSCSLVNSRWRDAVNKDVIWKQHCHCQFNLERAKSVVQPVFKLPMTDVGKLTPICRNRITYMRETHLQNNYKNNRCIEYKHSVKSHRDEIVFLDRYAIVNVWSNDLYYIYDSEKQFVETCTVPYLLQNKTLHTFKATRDYLVAVQCNLLQVFGVVNTNFVMKLCTIFDQDEEFSSTIPAVDITSYSADRIMTAWYRSVCGWGSCESVSDLTGNYFVGIITHPHTLNQSMHIWNIATGKKVKEETLPGIDCSLVTEISCSLISDYLYIALKYHLKKPGSAAIEMKMFCYDLKTLQYTKFKVQLHRSYIPHFSKNVIAIFPQRFKNIKAQENGGGYLFLDSSTGKKLVEKRTAHWINTRSVDIYGSLLVYGTCCTITVIDLNTLTHIAEYNVDFEVNNLCLLSPSIFVVAGRSKHVEVWDMKKHCALYTLNPKNIAGGIEIHKHALPKLSLVFDCGSYKIIHIFKYW